MKPEHSICVSLFFGNDPRMLATTRVIAIDGGELHYVMEMHTTSVNHLAMHLEAALVRR